MKKNDLMKMKYASISIIVILSFSSAIYTTAFAFDRVCIEMIPGAWFVAKMRIGTHMPNKESTTYTAWSNSITVGYQACFSTKGYAVGSIIEPEVNAVGGAIAKCAPQPLILYLSFPGTYLYDTWGEVNHIYCKGEGNSA